MKFTQRSIPYHFGLTLGAPDMLQYDALFAMFLFFFLS